MLIDGSMLKGAILKALEEFKGEELNLDSEKAREKIASVCIKKIDEELLERAF